MNVSEVTGNNSTSADQSPTAHQPTEGALDHPPFFEHEALGLSGRSTTWTINGRRPSPTSGKGAPPPSTQMVKRQSDLSMRLTRLRTRLPPSRSGTLAAVTNTRNTRPNVSTLKNRLRPLMSLRYQIPLAGSPQPHF